MKIPVHSTCPCGLEVQGEIKRPKYFQPTFLKLSCTCGSLFLIRCRREKGEYKLNTKILDLSKRAEDCVATGLGLKEPEVG